MSSKAEKKQLEEEAMAEWLSRGFDIKDFSLDKMLGICYAHTQADSRRKIVI